MSKPTITYFDFHGGRGEDCRLALHASGVDFVDNRIKGSAWGDHKGSTPFGSLPTFEVGGHTLWHSNTILAFIGRHHDMHPTDRFEAARHESLMGSCEDLRSRVDRVISIKDPEKRQTVREEMANGLLQTWGGYFEAQLPESGFLGGDKPYVADYKLFVLMKWFRTGGIDHVPATVFDGFPRLTAHYEAVKNHESVQSWYAEKGVTL